MEYEAERAHTGGHFEHLLGEQTGERGRDRLLSVVVLSTKVRRDLAREAGQVLNCSDGFVIHHARHNGRDKVARYLSGENVTDFIDNTTLLN